jgi:hypothetical protein
MIRRLAAVLAATLLAALAPAVPTTAARGGAAYVVVLGIPGLRWDSVAPSGTPALWRLTARGSLGALSTRTARPRTCPADGWVSLGAGNRARGPATPRGGRCRDVTRVPDDAALAATRRDNSRLPFGARVGAVQEQLARRGRCVTAVGAGTRYAAPAADPLPLATATPATFARCPVTIVAGTGDADVAAVERLRPPGSVLLVVGLSERGADRTRLHVAIADGPGFDHQQLTSASTRRPPYVQLIDVTPTVLDLLAIGRPEGVVGQPWRDTGPRISDAAAQVADLVDLDLAAVAMARVTAPFFAILLIGQALLYLLATLAVRVLPRWRDRHRAVHAARVVALAGAGALAGAFLANLAPWWRAEHPLPALLAAVAVADAGIVAVATLGPWRRSLLGPAGAVATIIALVLAVDLATGGRLQMSSVAGYSPLVAGRFAGIGNVAYGIFATAALLSAAVLVRARSRRTAVLVVAAVGVLAVVVDGAPSLGSDVGGVIALVPAFAVLGMLVGGTRISPRRLLLAGLAGVVVVAAFALVDYARPPADQTHLGRFVGQLLHGGAGTTVRRKAEANVHLLTHSVLTMLVPLVVLLVAALLLRPPGGLRRAFERAPELRAGLVATLVMAVIGFGVNDSGIAVPALAIALAVPLAIAVSVSAVLADAHRGAGQPVRWTSAAAPADEHHQRDDGQDHQDGDQ